MVLGERMQNMSTQLPNGWTLPDRPHVHVPHDRLGKLPCTKAGSGFLLTLKKFLI